MRVRGAVCLVGMGAACLGACQEAPKLGFESETSFQSRYVWRGMLVDRNPAIQSNNVIRFGQLSLDVWNTGRSLKPAMGAGSDEVDVTAAWETSWGSLTLEPYLTYYSYAKSVGARDTMETGFTAGFDWNGLSLYTSHCVDLRTARGAYYGEVGLELERDLSAGWTWGALLSLGWGDSKFNAFNLDASHGGLSSGVAQLGLTYHWGPSFYIRPSVTYASLLDKKLRQAAGKGDNLVWSISFGFAR